MAVWSLAAIPPWLVMSRGFLLSASRTAEQLMCSRFLRLLHIEERTAYVTYSGFLQHWPYVDGFLPLRC